MPEFSPTLVGCIVAIVAIELVMWKLFLRRVAGLQFPREIDTSFFGFFTLLRMRMVIILHAVAMVAVLFVLHSKL